MKLNERNFFALRLFIGAVLFTASLFVIACDPVTEATGSVRDKNGNPLEDVKVTMYSSSEVSNAGSKKESEQKTDAAGKFNFVAVTPGAVKITLTFKKEGFVTIEKEIKPIAKNDLNIVLEPAAN